MCRSCKRSEKCSGHDTGSSNGDDAETALKGGEDCDEFGAGSRHVKIGVGQTLFPKSRVFSLNIRYAFSHSLSLGHSCRIAPPADLGSTLPAILKQFSVVVLLSTSDDIFRKTIYMRTVAAHHGQQSLDLWKQSGLLERLRDSSK